MATSGRIETGRRNGTCFYHQWQLAGQDIGGNFSIINYQAGINIVGNNWWGSNSVRITGGGINGVGIGGGAWGNLRGAGDKQLLAGTVHVGHNGDGTKAFYYDIIGTLYGNGGLSTSGWAELPTIPRQSNPSFSKGVYTLGEQIWLNMNRKANFTHQGSLQIPDGNEIVRFENAQGEFVWTPDEAKQDEIYRRMANTTRTSLGADITTWNGGTQIGSIGWVNAEIQLDPSKITPTFENFNFRDTNPATVAITGNNQVLIANKSKLRAEILPAQKMTTKKYATPREYVAQFDGQSLVKAYSDTESVIFDFPNAPTSSGSVLAQIIAKDSRDLGQTKSTSIQVIPYNAPTLKVEAKRQNNFDSTTELRISGNFAPLTINNSDKNRIQSIKYRYRPTSGTWTAWKDVTPSQQTGSFTAPTQFLNLESAGSHEIEIQVIDKLETTTATATVERGRPLVFFSSNKEKVGINKVPEFGDLDVLGDIFSRGSKVLTDSQAERDHWEMIDMGWGAKGLFYKKNGFCGFRLSFTGTYGNGQMLERIKEKYLPKHETAFAGICINNNRHSGGFIIKLGLNGEITKRGTDSYEEYHVSGVYLAKNDL